MILSFILGYWQKLIVIVPENGNLLDKFFSSSTKPNYIISALNGLFTPTEAQEFFEAERGKLKREIGFYRPQKILEIDGATIDKNYQIEPMKVVPPRKNRLRTITKRANVFS